MSFFKKLLGPRPDSAPAADAPALAEATKSLVFNAFGSATYDDLVWLGQHHAEPARVLYRALDYVAEAARLLAPQVPDAQALVARQVGPSLSGLRQTIPARPHLATRLLVNSTEFQARVGHALQVLQGSGQRDAGPSLTTWLEQEQANQAAATAGATLFNAPLSLSLARDPAWTAIDAAPRTRMLLWGTLSAASVFAAHLLHHLQRHVELPRPETRQAVYAHLRVAWLGYGAQVLDAGRSASERAVTSYFALLAGDPRVLDVYGLHMMNVFRAQLYGLHTAAANYAHFAGLLLPVAPQVAQLDEAAARAFFTDSGLLPLMAAETQWMQHVARADLTQEQVAGLNQNLLDPLFAAMRQGTRPEFGASPR